MLERSIPYKKANVAQKILVRSLFDVVKEHREEDYHKAIMPAGELLDGQDYICVFVFVCVRLYI